MFLQNYLVCGWKKLADDMWINSHSGMLIKKKYPWMTLPWRVMYPIKFEKFPQLSLEEVSKLELSEITIAYKNDDTASDGADDIVCRQRRKGSYTFYNNYLDFNFQNFASSLRGAAIEALPSLKFKQDYDVSSYRRFIISGPVDNCINLGESIAYIRNEANKFVFAEKSILKFSVEDKGERIIIRGFEKPEYKDYSQN